MPEATTDWPYDARPGDIAERYRIPIVSTLYPRLSYILCVDVDDQVWRIGEMPSEAEFRLIRSFLDFKLSKYFDSYVRELAKRPFDIDDAANTMVLAKRAEGDWCYRLRTWSRGPTVVPDFRDSNKLDLAGVLDRYAHFSSPWTDWQVAHPA